MYKFPIKIPSNLNLILSQPFHVAQPTDISQAYKVQTTGEHLGVDITCGTPQQTWGQECVWPFPWPGVVYSAEVDSEFGATKHAHSQIDTTDPLTGIKYSLIYLHLSFVPQTKAETDNTYIVYHQGDVVGRIGNNGAVSPMPTPQAPLQGSHLHLGLAVQKPGELNATLVDPLQYFDVTFPYRLDTPPISTPPAQNGELSTADKVALVAAKLEASGNTTQANIVWKLVAFLKAFGQ